MANLHQKPNLFHFYLGLISILILGLFASCEKPQVQKKEAGYPLADIIQEKSYWEGSSIEASDTFFIDDEDMFCFKDSKRPYTGVIKVRARNGTVAALRSYNAGVPDGDFYEWHENGNLKSKQQYKTDSNTGISLYGLQVMSSTQEGIIRTGWRTSVASRTKGWLRLEQVLPRWN